MMCSKVYRANLSNNALLQFFHQLFTYSGGGAQGINLSAPISPTTLSLITSQRPIVSSASLSSLVMNSPRSSNGGSGLRWASPPSSSGNVVVTSGGSAFIEDNLTYDQLAAMSPMLVQTSNDHGGGHGSLMDDGKLGLFYHF